MPWLEIGNQSLKYVWRPRKLKRMSDSVVLAENEQKQKEADAEIIFKMLAPPFYAKRALRKSTRRPGPNAPFANEIARLVSENPCFPGGRQALEPALCQLGAPCDRAYLPHKIIIYASGLTVVAALSAWVTSADLFAVRASKAFPCISLLASVPRRTCHPFHKAN